MGRCADRRQASSVARPDAGGAQLQTRVRRAGVKSSVTELRPHPRDKTRQKQGYQEVYVNNTHWQETRIVYECVRQTAESRKHLKLQKINERGKKFTAAIVQRTGVSVLRL